MSVSTSSRPTLPPLGAVLAALSIVGLAACSDGGHAPAEQPAQIQTSVDFGSLSDVGAQWWTQAGAERAFYFSVRNYGRTATHVPLTVMLGPNLRLVSVQCAKGESSCMDTSAGSSAFAIDSISMGEHVRVIVRASEQNPQSYRAQVLLVAELPGDPDPWNNSALHDRAVLQADRSVALNAPAAAAAGTDVEVELTIANLGPDFFYETRRPALPAGVVGEELACRMSDGADCTTATLDHSDVGVRASRAAVLRYRLTVPADYRGPLTVSKTVSSSGDTNPADNSASATIQVSAPGGS